MFTGATGVGKTQALCEAIAEEEEGNVGIYGPSIPKSVESRDKLLDLGSKLVPHAYLGRLAPNPRKGETFFKSE